MPRLERVFVDTATLYPISLADLVLRLAELGMFEFLWSEASDPGYSVEAMGLEPTTSCLQSKCSSQLSYAPVGTHRRRRRCGRSSAARFASPVPEPLRNDDARPPSVHP